jgi:hypothetical protein
MERGDNRREHPEENPVSRPRGTIIDRIRSREKSEIPSPETEVSKFSEHGGPFDTKHAIGLSPKSAGNTPRSSNTVLSFNDEDVATSSDTFISVITPTEEYGFRRTFSKWKKTYWDSLLNLHRKFSHDVGVKPSKVNINEFIAFVYHNSSKYITPYA